MLVQTTVQGHLQVNSICVEALPLSSVSDGAVYQPNGADYFYPIGDNAFVSDKPLSSAKGRQLLSNLRLLQKRPRMLFTASAIDVNADGTVLIAPYNGNIGFGTATPTSKFHFVGDINLFGNEYIRGSLGISEAIGSEIGRAHV